MAEMETEMKSTSGEYLSCQKCGCGLYVLAPGDVVLCRPCRGDFKRTGA